MTFVVLTALMAFVASGSYLAIQGEFRAGMRALARRDDRLLRIKEKQERMQKFLTASTSASEYSAMDMVEKANAG